MTNKDSYDLDWQAFRYVAGEMSSDEAAVFERRLADDQSAREAVADAVELAQALATLGPEAREDTRPVPKARLGSGKRTWRRRAVWTVAGTAACVALIVTSWLYRGGETAQSTDLSLEQLALLWSQIGEELDPRELDEWAEDFSDDPTDQDADVPPSWMLAAVSESANAEFDRELQE